MFGHVKRRDSEYIGRRMLKIDIPGRRQRGGSKTRFKDVERDDIQIVGVREEDTRWKGIICCGHSK